MRHAGIHLNKLPKRSFQSLEKGGLKDLFNRAHAGGLCRQVAMHALMRVSRSANEAQKLMARSPTAMSPPMLADYVTKQETA